MKTTQDVLTHFIKDLYSAAVQQLSYYPEVTNLSDALNDGLSAHIQEIKQQIWRLKKLWNEMDLGDLDAVHCKGMEWLIREIKHVVDDLDGDADEDAKTYALVWAIRRCKHYEIAGYETILCCVDEQHTQLLESILWEAKNADQKLAKHIK